MSGSGVPLAAASQPGSDKPGSEKPWLERSRASRFGSSVGPSVAIILGLGVVLFVIAVSSQDGNLDMALWMIILALAILPCAFIGALVAGLVLVLIDSPHGARTVGVVSVLSAIAGPFLMLAARS